MSASNAGRTCLYRRHHPRISTFPSPRPHVYQQFSIATKRALQKRAFSTSRRSWKQTSGEGEKFTTRAGRAWRNTKIEWKPIPIALGVGFLGFWQFLRIQRREQEAADAEGGVGPVPKRERIRPSGGGWQVTVMSTLPLKALSRVWGKFNELNIPYYLRVPGFKLYGWIFGVNFDEIKEPDLHNFPNLAAFFYREIKPEARPLDPNPAAIISPADARVLQYGMIEQGEVEQVKGMTYTLDALLGKSAPSRTPSPSPHHHHHHHEGGKDTDHKSNTPPGNTANATGTTQGQGQGQASTSTTPTPTRTMPTPEETARRLLAQHQDRRNANPVFDVLYRIEQGIALFLASLIPGVGERHVRAREEARRIVEEDDRRRREETEQQQQQQGQIQNGSADNKSPDAVAVGTSPAAAAATATTSTSGPASGDASSSGVDRTGNADGRQNVRSRAEGGGSSS